jgi:hypothetical protein
MLTATNQFHDFWAALELEMSDTLGHASEWLVSLKIVMAHVERALATGGRGAYIFVLTPREERSQAPDAEGASAPPQEGRPTPAGE